MNTYTACNLRSIQHHRRDSGEPANPLYTYTGTSGIRERENIHQEKLFYALEKVSPCWELGSWYFSQCWKGHCATLHERRGVVCGRYQRWKWVNGSWGTH